MLSPQDEAIDKEIAAVKAVIACTRDPERSKSLGNRINQLQALKRSIEMESEGDEGCIRTGPPPAQQQHHNKNKRLRADLPANSSPE